ncbi:glycine--tRNA ligase [Candidatus Micrarchaeota archaeon]|nr:glycine--tRNA ligase [Candidatus Micrarchaeota archaeon]
MANSKHLTELISFLQDKGYVWGPEPEIYNGLSGFYTYAPLGKLLKNNIENKIREFFIKNEFWEVECPIIMPKIVWEASGHLDGFTDSIIFCSKCNASYRADKLLEEQLPNQGHTINDILPLIKEGKLKCSSCKGNFKMEILSHELMMKTTVGLDLEAYNRPETATTTYLPFNRYVTFFRNKIPFGVFQIGKAFRNEISPRQHILRMREFTQAEAQLIIFDKNEFEKFDKIKNNNIFLWSAENQLNKKDPFEIKMSDAITKKMFKNKAYAWTVYSAYELFLSFGIPKENIRVRQHRNDEKAFYADDAWDIEINLKSFNWEEVCGIHDRTNYDLKQHMQKSGKSFEILNEKTGKKEIPHILEIAFGTDRPVFALLDLFYSKEDKENGKTMFKIPYLMAPIKTAIYPLVKKEGLPELAQNIYEKLSKHFVCVYDESGSIGRRYLRAAEQGIPFCITVDFDTLKDNTVTIRDRNTEEQKRIKIDKLIEIIDDLISEETSFKKV